MSNQRYISTRSGRRALPTARRLRSSMKCARIECFGLLGSLLPSRDSRLWRNCLSVGNCGYIAPMTLQCVCMGGGGCVCASCVERGSRIKRKRFLKVSDSASEVAAPLAHLSFLKTPRFSNWLCFFSCNGTHRSMTKPLPSVCTPTQTQTRRYTYIPSLPNHLRWPHTGSATAAHTA